MAAIQPDMAELDERDREVLQVFAEGRANPLLVRERTGFEKGDVNTVLVRLGRGGYVEQVTTGLYEITEKGRAEVGSTDDVERAIGELESALERGDRPAIEDALDRLKGATGVGDE